MKRSEYRPYDYPVEGQVLLTVRLHETETRISALYNMRRAEYATEDAPLVLNLGREVTLQSLQIDGRLLASGKDFTREGNVITVPNVPAEFSVKVQTTVNPQVNTELMGLYISDGMLITQCEADGFHRITAFPDRPDVLAAVRTTLVGDKTKYPILLSNGNLIKKGECVGSNDHFAVWDNPFKMPCYLFALVAGDLAVIRGVHVTAFTGRIIELAIFGEKRHTESGQLDHALASLKLAMAFDERMYGRECDLDMYMIVAVSHFNMGAMENKGLNLFNTKYVLARPDTATDGDYEHIEGVIGHEYFHNWTGNRITCKDWMNLGLKEGLTVFRDQQFSRERWGLRKIIQDIREILGPQFKEDAGPLAHPVLPEEIKAVSNMYTVTIYEKGAEVYRMLFVLLGEDGFRKGMDLYFERHDGQAVGIEDLVRCMSDANGGRDLSQFVNWFLYAGTPSVEIKTSYDENTRAVTMTVRQSCPPTPGQPEKPPFHIPLEIGFVGPYGDMLFRDASGAYDTKTSVLHITKPVEKFVFRHGPSAGFVKPVLSLNRGAAPVKVKYAYGSEDLAFLMKHDPHPVGRWEAAQHYASQVILNLVEDAKAGKELVLDKDFVSAFYRVLTEADIDKTLLAAMIELPSEGELANQSEVVEPAAIHLAREFVRCKCGELLFNEFVDLYSENFVYEEYPVSFEPDSVAKRALANVALSYLVAMDKTGWVADGCFAQFTKARNLTDKLAALTLLVHDGHRSYRDRKAATVALGRFYEQYKDEGNVVDQWLAVQAKNPQVTVEEIKALQEHPAYDQDNPNRVRSVVASFVRDNPFAFHYSSGKGYAFLADFIIGYVEKNPIIAARIIDPLTEWKRYEPVRSALMKAELVRLKAALSKLPKEKTLDVLEKVNNALAE